MTDPNPKPDHERFNNLCPGETLEPFHWFELVACRVNKTDDCVVRCPAEEAEFWAIYGRQNYGEADDPQFAALSVHEETDPAQIVRVARQIAIETGKGFVAGDTVFGLFPNRISIGISPVDDFTEIAEDLTTAIHHDLEANIAPENRREDDFDTHPLTPLREAFVAYSDYSGSDQLDPYRDREL